MQGGVSMHATERERAILGQLRHGAFTSFRELAERLGFPQPTLRHDLQRMADAGLVDRVHGGVRLAAGHGEAMLRLAGLSFEENMRRNLPQKAAIGRAAAALCRPGEAVMIDGGSTTLQMCPHLGGRDLQVLTNSLPIMSALMAFPDVRVAIPGGALFREQAIIVSPGEDDLMPHFHAPRLFMGAAAVGPHGVMQADVMLLAAERRLIEKAEELILLVDSDKCNRSSGHVVCALEEVDVLITDRGISDEARALIAQACVQLVIAD